MWRAQVASRRRRSPGCCWMLLVPDAACDAGAEGRDPAEHCIFVPGPEPRFLPRHRQSDVPLQLPRIRRMHHSPLRCPSPSLTRGCLPEVVRRRRGRTERRLSWQIRRGEVVGGVGVRCGKAVSQLLPRLVRALEAVRHPLPPQPLCIMVRPRLIRRQLLRAVHAPPPHALRCLRHSDADWSSYALSQIQLQGHERLQDGCQCRGQAGCATTTAPPH